MLQSRMSVFVFKILKIDRFIQVKDKNLNKFILGFGLLTNIFNYVQWKLKISVPQKNSLVKPVI